MRAKAVFSENASETPTQPSAGAPRRSALCFALTRMSPRLAMFQVQFTKPRLGKGVLCALVVSGGLR